MKFIESNKGQGAGTWAKLFLKPSYKIWSGFSFETICLKHIVQIKKALGVPMVYSINSAWHNDKAQIDLVIDRDDNIINLCEMKFHDAEYTIDKNELINLKNKVSQFRTDTNTKKNLFLTFITTHGVKPNSNSLELLDNNLVIDCLFQTE